MAMSPWGSTRLPGSTTASTTATGTRMTAERTVVALAAPTTAFTATFSGRRPRRAFFSAMGSSTEPTARANTRSSRGRANRHPATTSAKEMVSYRDMPAASPMIMPAISPHRVGSSKKPPRLVCSSEK